MRQGFVKLTPIGYKKLTVSTTVISLAPADVPSGTVAFYMQADQNPVRWTADGSNPVAGSEGMLARSTQPEPMLHPFHPGKLKFVRNSAADGVLLFTFFGE